MAPGAIVVAAVLVCLGERKQEIDLGLDGQAATRDATFHLGDASVVEAVGLQVGEAPVGLAEIGKLADAGVIGGDGLVVAADGFQDMAEADQGADMRWPQLQAVLVGLDGLLRE